MSIESGLSVRTYFFWSVASTGFQIHAFILPQSSSDFKWKNIGPGHIEYPLKSSWFRVCEHEGVDIRRDSYYIQEMAIKLIIFDLDGTLINSIEDITNALNYAFQPCGVNDLTPAEVAPLIGEGPSKLIQDVLAKYNLLSDKEALVARFLDYYTSHPTVKTVPYPGTRETLETLKALKMAIVTNKTEEISRKTLKTFALDAYFDMIIGVDTIAERKPSPVPVLHVLSAFNITPEEAIIVGDSEVDIQTGKASNVRTVAVTHGYGKNGFQEKADFVISSLPELIDIVKDEDG
ncbi:MAG: hypothetical protein C0399_09025 [Syntrophus sp. (in: bacteria)]|nr:hypothetical protein [Syntrophus sp. (in: bacteria)]